MMAPAGLPSLSGEFIQVDISAEGAAQKEWTEPVHVWFKRTAAGWKLVGLERVQ
jgi:hypothetical protein